MLRQQFRPKQAYHQAILVMNAKTGFLDDKGISPGARGYMADAVKLGLLKGCPDKM